MSVIVPVLKKKALLFDSPSYIEITQVIWRIYNCKDKYLMPVEEITLS